MARATSTPAEPVEAAGAVDGHGLAGPETDAPQASVRHDRLAEAERLDRGHRAKTVDRRHEASWPLHILGEGAVDPISLQVLCTLSETRKMAHQYWAGSANRSSTTRCGCMLRRWPGLA